MKIPSPDCSGNPFLHLVSDVFDWLNVMQKRLQRKAGSRLLKFENKKPPHIIETVWFL